MIDVRAQVARFGFSPAAIKKLGHYADLLIRWNKAINLVAPTTINHLWERHFLDSAQLWGIINQYNSDATSIIDLGSGGGLPGLVLAMAGADTVTMIESDKRKCVFLNEVSRETKLENARVINERIERVKLEKADFVTARALAPLSQLIAWATPLLKENGHMIFLKGADVATEIRDLPLEIQSNIKAYPSITNPLARIIVL